MKAQGGGEGPERVAKIEFVEGGIVGPVMGSQASGGSPWLGDPPQQVFESSLRWHL